jgi:hypothetical protein
MTLRLSYALGALFAAPTPLPLFLDFQSECRRQRLVNVASWKPVFDGWRQYFGNRRADARRDARKRDGVKPPNPQRVLAKDQPGSSTGTAAAPSVARI